MSKQPNVKHIYTVVSEKQPKSVFIGPITTQQNEDDGLESSHLPAKLLTWIEQELKQQPKLFTHVETLDENDRIDATTIGTILDESSENKKLAALQKRIGTDLLIHGKLGQIDRKVVLILSLYDFEKRMTINRVSATIPPPIGSWMVETHDIKSILQGTWTVDPSNRYRSTSLLAHLFGFGNKDHGSLLSEKKSPKIGILNFYAPQIQKSVVDKLHQLPAYELKKVPGIQTLSHSKIEPVIGSGAVHQLMTSDCAQRCVIPLGDRLPIDYLLLGTIGRLDRTLFVTLRLVEPTSGQVIQSHRITFRGSEQELERAIRTLSRKIIGAQPKSFPGVIAVRTSVKGAKVTINNQSIGKSPIDLDSVFPTNRINVTVSKSGYLAWQSDVFVQPGEHNPIWADLESAPKGLLRKWWFWTIAGAVVAGGTTAAVMLTQQSTTNGTGSISFGQTPGR